MTRAQFSAFELDHFCVSKSSSFGVISEGKGPSIFAQALNMVPKGLQHPHKLTSQMLSFMPLPSPFQKVVKRLASQSFPRDCCKDAHTHTQLQHNGITPPLYFRHIPDFDTKSSTLLTIVCSICLCHGSGQRRICTEIGSVLVGASSS